MDYEPLDLPSFVGEDYTFAGNLDVALAENHVTCETFAIPVKAAKLVREIQKLEMEFADDPPVAGGAALRYFLKLKSKVAKDYPDTYSKLID